MIHAPDMELLKIRLLIPVMGICPTSSPITCASHRTLGTGLTKKSTGKLG